MREGSRRWWVVGGLVATAVAIGAVFAFVSSTMDDPASAAPTSTAAPQPISRAKLMEEYAKILPNDSGATPDAVDRVAEQSCDLLDEGHSTDELIESVTEIYGADATKVMQLLVSYQCPKYLADFK